MALIDNLVSYYKLDENAASTTVADSHGSNTGTASTNTNNLYDANGKINSAFDFLETNSEGVDLGTGIAKSTQLSISLWVKPVAESATEAMVARDAVAGRGYNFHLDGSLKMYLEVAGAGTTPANTVLSTGNWHHVVVTFDESNNEIKYYLNGAADGTASSAGTMTTNAIKTWIGRRDYSGAEEYFTGGIDEVGIWNKILTLTEATELYNSGSGLAYPFEEVYEYKPVYTKVNIEGTTYADTTKITVDKTIGEFNSTSNFKIESNNYNGKYSDTFNLNDEVIIYADRGTSPPTTKLFTGVIEDINFKGDVGSEKIVLIGRDYGAILQDMTVQPIIYKNKDVGIIARQIMLNNCEGLLTANNMDTSTGTVLEQKGFNQTNVFAALQELAELAGYYFYVDNDKDVHFEAKSSVSSGKTFDNTNVKRATFKKDDREIYNKIWVYGARVLTGANDVGGIGAGSVFKLSSKPHNARVSVGGVLQQPGGIYEMTNPATEADLKYVMDFNDKEVIFVSGTAAGDNIPASGASNVSVDYERFTPLLKYKEDATSISSYGPKSKIIKDDNLKSFPEVTDRAVTFLAANKEPKIQGDLDIKGVLELTPGNTCVVDLPWHGISSQTYTILSASYSFNVTNNRSDSVLSVTVNKKLSDFTDVMRSQMIRLKQFEVGPLEGEYTSLLTATGYVDVDTHYELWQRNINDNFIFHSDKHGILESPTSRFGTGVLGSTFITSGGGF